MHVVPGAIIGKGRGRGRGRGVSTFLFSKVQNFLAWSQYYASYCCFFTVAKDIISSLPVSMVSRRVQMSDMLSNVKKTTWKVLFHLFPMVHMPSQL